MRKLFLTALILGLVFPNLAAAENFSYEDKSQIVVSEITFSNQIVNTKDNDEPITINVKAFDTFNSFRIAVAEFYSEKAGHIGFAQAEPIRSTQTNGINTEEFAVNITIPKTLPEGLLFLILRFDSNKPDGSFWQTNLYAPVKYVPAAQPFPTNLMTTITNSWSAESVGATKAAAAKAAQDKSSAERQKIANEFQEKYVQLLQIAAGFNALLDSTKANYVDHQKYFDLHKDQYVSLRRAVDFPGMTRIGGPNQTDLDLISKLLLGNGEDIGLVAMWNVVSQGVANFDNSINLAKEASTHTLVCIKGKISKTIVMRYPKCPVGYKAKK